MALWDEHGGGGGQRAGGRRARWLRVVAPDEALPLVRRDALADFAEYRDTGCELSASCLRCPLPRCQYDEPVPAARRRRRERDRELVRLRDAGMTVNALAGRYALTRRQVFRILKAGQRRKW